MKGALSAAKRLRPQDIIRQTTEAFIEESDKHRELASRVVKAMPSVQRELCRRVLCTVNNTLETRALAGWEIRSSYKDDKKDLMRDHSYLALRR